MTTLELNVINAAKAWARASEALGLAMESANSPDYFDADLKLTRASERLLRAVAALEPAVPKSQTVEKRRIEYVALVARKVQLSIMIDGLEKLLAEMAR